MHYKPNDLQLQYIGYAQTPILWEQDVVLNLKQFEIDIQANPVLTPIFEKMRLGFRVERFIGTDLRRMKGIEVLAENIQVQDGKQTIGELDCLLLENGKPIHLEIIFKLYLYDETVGTIEIEHWIGGNRQDSLAKKLDKLKEKQLPLLFNPHTQNILKALDLKVEDIEQHVHFKAQLFFPFQTDVDFHLLNKDCLKGFYIKPDELHKFSKSLFYIPVKTDWLLEPQANAEWINFNQFQIIINPILVQRKHHLCWMRFPNGTMKKFFIVMWD